VFSRAVFAWSRSGRPSTLLGERRFFFVGFFFIGQRSPYPLTDLRQIRNKTTSAFIITNGGGGAACGS
jgi:hypothetical protein